MARNAWLQAGLPIDVPGVTVNRFCSSGLQAIAFAGMQIMSGMAEVMMAGGVESMSRVPGGGNKPMFGAALMDASPDAYLSMGLTAEKVASQFNVSREDQDAFAARSHDRSLAAIASGRFHDEIVPVPIPANQIPFEAHFSNFQMGTIMPQSTSNTPMRNSMRTTGIASRL